MEMKCCKYDPVTDVRRNSYGRFEKLDIGPNINYRFVQIKHWTVCQRTFVTHNIQIYKLRTWNDLTPGVKKTMPIYTAAKKCVIILKVYTQSARAV